VHTHSKTKVFILWITTGLPFIYVNTVLAAPDGVAQIDTFLRSIIQLLAGLAGLVASGFFVVGGYSYITSSGNPQRLDRAKRTITYAGLGLAITIAAFVISNIITTLATNAFGK
jgi:TRAP-type C4-dicarboxylate transport system permease small subunit